MKNYNVKYDLKQEVYVLSSKKIIKSKIQKIKIEEDLPYLKVINGELKEMNGIEINYLVITDEKKSQFSDAISYSYDWYNQDDIFLDKDELIRNII